MNKRRTMMALIICISLMVACFMYARAEQYKDPDEPEWQHKYTVDELIQKYANDTKCRDFSIVVYRKGETEYYGDSKALYQIGSMTKAFTGLAVQKLINEGFIEEDKLVSDYIPGFRAYYKAEEADISVKDLLEQKSGYTNSEKDYPSATEEMTLSGWAESISGRELKCRPGTEYAYSNTNYNLLGLIIEKVSGLSYREYMESEILRPLGLNNTFVGKPEGDGIVEGTRLGFRRVFDFTMAVREGSIPAGYFYSNTEDMGRWAQIWLNSADIPTAFEEPLAKIRGRLKEEGDYYSGWERFSLGMTGHSGGTANYSSRLVFSEERQTAVCVLSNLNVAAGTDSLCNGIYGIKTGRACLKLSGDIWTVFDLIFSTVTLCGIVLFATVLIIKKRTVLMVSDLFMLVLLVSILVSFPLIFSADMKEIMFTWAPWSLTAGLAVITVDIAAVSIKLLIGRKHADNNKRGEG